MRGVARDIGGGQRFYSPIVALPSPPLRAPIKHRNVRGLGHLPPHLITCLYYTMNAITLRRSKPLSLVSRELYNIDLWSPSPPNIDLCSITSTCK